MYKITNEGTYSLPFNKDTNFYVDGHWHYTIIDVASYNGSVYALLESNTCGEEDMLVVELPQSNIKLLRLYDEGMMRIPGRSKMYEYEVFIPRRKIIVETAYNDIVTELVENLLDSVDEELISVWTDEDIEEFAR